jgi:hypothetical protein
METTFIFPKGGEQSVFQGGRAERKWAQKIIFKLYTTTFTVRTREFKIEEYILKQF